MLESKKQFVKHENWRNAILTKVTNDQNIVCTIVFGGRMYVLQMKFKVSLHVFSSKLRICPKKL